MSLTPGLRLRPGLPGPVRFLFSLVLLLALGAPASAQPADTLSTDDGWRSSLVAHFAATQAAYSNWQEGGINALSVSSKADGTFDRVMGRVLLRQEAAFAFAVLKQDTLELRKADDLIRYAIQADLLNDGNLYPSAKFTARSQIAAGFDYSPTLDEYPVLPFTPGEALKVSAFAAPATLSQSLGVVYAPGGGFRARTGLGLKETIVGIERLRPVYGNDLDETVRVQAGLDAELGLERPLMENVFLKSRLTAFQAFNQVGDQAPDVLFENTLTLKVNDLLNVTLDAATLYDRDVSDELQLRESFAVGVSFALL